MAKTILKEVIIILLLCLAIILILGVLLYGYVPANKVIPEAVAYVAPDEIKEELAETITSDDLEVILTYEVDATDLRNAERINIYNPGKPNPFSSYEQTATSTSDSADTTNANSSTTSSSNSSSGSTSTNTNSYSTVTGTK